MKFKYFLILLVIQCYGSVVRSSPDNSEFKISPKETRMKIEATCTAISPQEIKVSWDTVPKDDRVRKFSVRYEVMDYERDVRYEIKSEISSNEIVLNKLFVHTKYEVNIRAYDDQVDPTKIICQTGTLPCDEPIISKVSVISNKTVIVSWKSPLSRIGTNKFKIYQKSVNRDDIEKILISKDESEIFSNLLQEPYEFWVSALVDEGEICDSNHITVTPSNEIPAKISSFGGFHYADVKRDTSLICSAYGSPSPNISWTFQGVEIQPNIRIEKWRDGHLYFDYVVERDIGEYVCTAENSLGSDSITYKMVVITAPKAPEIHLQQSTNDSITLVLRKNKEDIEVDKFKIYYKLTSGDWETTEFQAWKVNYTINNLFCGSRYQLYATAINHIGEGAKSDSINLNTEGSKSVAPKRHSFIQTLDDSIKLDMTAWKNEDCRIQNFTIEYREENESEWNLISNDVNPIGPFAIYDLKPNTSYNLKVIAHNSRSSIVANYESIKLGHDKNANETS